MREYAELFRNLRPTISRGDLDAIITNCRGHFSLKSVREIGVSLLPNQEAGGGEKGWVCRFMTHPPTPCASCMGQGKSLAFVIGRSAWRLASDGGILGSDRRWLSCAAAQWVALTPENAPAGPPERSPVFHRMRRGGRPAAAGCIGVSPARRRSGLADWLPAPGWFAFRRT
jgi:hypothetical protein